MNLEAGPTAVIRNAGGRAMDSMRTLHVLNAINPLGLVVVVHHTGMWQSHRKQKVEDATERWLTWWQIAARPMSRMAKFENSSGKMVATARSRTSRR